ncbi:MAG: hypothetical protein JO201_08295 [Verrucomicrobia bacterium]|nr:hypothetical protein [Verrucomicrobiota bacterium]
MKKPQIALLIGVAIVFVWSGINPHDRLTWWLEVFPAIIGFVKILSCVPVFLINLLL